LLALEATECEGLHRTGEEQALELLDLAAALHRHVGIGDVVALELGDTELHQLSEQDVIARRRQLGGHAGEDIAVNH
jgi:hypothetical protein